LKETTPLFTDRIKPESKTEYIQPALMMTASAASVVAGFFALAAGADKVKQADGTTALNPFFLVAMANSSVYVVANAIQCGRIYQRHKCTWAQLEDERREANALRSVRIDT
jgi:hypothetical protein